MRVIGLISGTSVDGIDAALVDITGEGSAIKVDLIAAETYPYPANLRSHILEVCAGKPLSMANFAELDNAIACQFAQAALQVQASHAAADLIGSHGQTVFHSPLHHSPSPKTFPGTSSGTSPKTFPEISPKTSLHLSPFPPASAPLGYSLQLGRGDLVAHLTGTPTVSNFRAADIAAGGQGAPLVSPVDACLLGHPSLSRCIQNIGGIGNVTYLPAYSNREQSSQNHYSQNCHPQNYQHQENQPQTSSASAVAGFSVSPCRILGWDTGPGNALLDLAVHHLSDGTQAYDQDGDWAASGTPCQALVDRWLQQSFFQQPPPKSTGRELFGQAYWEQCWKETQGENFSPADLLATLTELTAAAIAHSYRTFLPQMPDQVLVCGGGSRNRYLMTRIRALLNPISVLTTDDAGLNADFKEAIAFAVLAYWRMNGVPGNSPEVTGAKQHALLGEIHMAR